MYLRIPSKLLRGLRSFISRTFHCGFKKRRETGKLSDMALLNFSLSGKRSHINAMD